VSAPPFELPVQFNPERRKFVETVAFVIARFVEVALVEVELIDVSNSIEDEAETKIPLDVDVGVRAPNEFIEKSRNCELK
jgi:hypothetical protein